MNKLSHFWQELKHRKVVRVISVYAAAAFVILELVSIIAEPLRLPESFLTIVIVLLCIGIIIAIILSWIFDVTPEAIEKAYNNKSPEFPWLKVNPAFNSLKDDPGYWDLYERTGHKAYDDHMASKQP